MSVTETGRKTRRKAQDTADQTTDQAKDAVDEPREQEQDGDSSSSGDTLMGELKTAVREAAVEVLKPVARKATLAAAKLAVSQGPSLVKDKVAPKVADAGGPAAMAKDLAGKGGELTEKLPFMGGGKDGKDKGKSGKPSGTGRGRRLPVQEFIDVASDIQTVYDQFTQFEDWPRFMHRVEKIEQRDDTTLMWHENIWGVRRQWEAEITEQVPCERIAWRSKGEVQTVGVATFHKLADNLTRIYLTVDYQPKGVLEKSASGFRLSRRAIKSDLMRFKAFVEMRDEATGGWGGRIEDGEVVDSEQDEPEGREEQDEPEAKEEQEQDEEDEEREERPRRRKKGRFTRDEPRDEEESEDEDEYEDDEEEPEAEADEEEYADDEDDEELEEEEPPKPRRRRSKAKSSSRGA